MPVATLPASAAARSRVLGDSEGELRFQVRGGEHGGRVIRIAGAKCTIGSAAGCTFRLRGAGIQPLHCLIVCGRNGTVIRRSSPETYLNGGTFEDSPLVPGDVLRVGGVELAVVACPCRAAPARDELPAPRVAAREPARSSEPERESTHIPLLTEKHQERSIRETYSAREARRQARSRQRKLIAELRKERERSQRSQSSLQVLEERWAAASARTQAKEENESATAQALLRLQAEHEEQQGRLERERHEQKFEQIRLSHQIADLADQLQLCRQQLEVAQKSSQARAEQYSQSAIGLQKEYDEMLARQRHERVEFQAQKEKLESDLTATRQSLAALESRLAAKSSSHTSEYESLAAEVELLRGERENHEHLRRQEVEAATARCAALQEEINAQGGRLAERERELEELRHGTVRQMQELSRALEESRREEQKQRQAREKERDDFTAARGRLEQELSGLTDQLQEKIAELEASHRRAGESADSLTTVLHQARLELVQLQSQQRRQQRDWTTVRARLEQENSVLAAQLHQRESELDEFRTAASQAAHAEIAVEQMRQQLIVVQSQLASERQSWQTERDELQAGRESLAAQLHDRQAELAEARQATASQVGEMSNLMDQLRRDREDAQEEAAERRAGFERAQSAWQKELAAARTELAHKQEACDALSVELRQAEAELELRKEQCLALERQLTENVSGNGGFSSWQDRARTAEEHVERWQAEAHARQIEIEGLRQRTAEREEELSGLRRILESLQQDASLVSEAQERERQALQAEMAELQRREQSLVKEREQLESQRAELDAQRAEVKERREQMALEQEGIVARESELAGREASWNASRQEQERLLEQATTSLAEQALQLAGERAAFAEQQTLLEQKMSAIEERVQGLAVHTVVRQTNSPFLVPSPDDVQSLMGDAETSDNPYVSGAEKSSAIQLPDADPELAAKVASDQSGSDSPVGDAVSRLAQAGVWKDNPRGDSDEPITEGDALAPQPIYQPTSFLERAAEMVREEEEAASRGGSAGMEGPSTTNCSVPPLPETSAEAAKAEEDESIEQYMAKLLNRVRKGDANGAPARPQVTSSSPPIDSAPPPASAPLPEFTAPSEFTPRSPAPEHSASLSAMRELANTAARSAIQTHVQRNARGLAKRTSLLAVISLAGSLALGAIGWFAGSVLAYGGCAFFLGVGLLASIRALTNATRQMRRKPPAVSAEGQVLGGRQSEELPDDNSQYGAVAENSCAQASAPSDSIAESGVSAG